MLRTGGFSCVVTRNNCTFNSNLKGIRPILNWLGQDDMFFKDSIVADKIVGKAAALLFIYAGVQAIFTLTISESAIEIFNQHNVYVEYEKTIPHILNQSGDDICPMEKKVANISSPQEAFDIFSDTLSGSIRWQPTK